MSSAQVAKTNLATLQQIVVLLCVCLPAACLVVIVSVLFVCMHVCMYVCMVAC